VYSYYIFSGVETFTFKQYVHEVRTTKLSSYGTCLVIH